MRQRRAARTDHPASDRPSRCTHRRSTRSSSRQSGACSSAGPSISSSAVAVGPGGSPRSSPAPPAARSRRRRRGASPHPGRTVILPRGPMASIRSPIRAARIQSVPGTGAVEGDVDRHRPLEPGRTSGWCSGDSRSCRRPVGPAASGPGPARTRSPSIPGAVTTTRRMEGVSEPASVTWRCQSAASASGPPGRPTRSSIRSVAMLGGSTRKRSGVGRRGACPPQECCRTTTRTSVDVLDAPETGPSRFRHGAPPPARRGNRSPVR